MRSGAVNYSVACGPVGRPYRVAAYFPIHCGGGGHSHTCLSLCEHVRGDRLELELFVPSADGAGQRPFTRAALPDPLHRLVYRLHRNSRLPQRVLQTRYRAALPRADLAYLWAGTPETVYVEARRAGVPICVERINCHRATALPILEEAYRRAGLVPTHGITQADLVAERRKLAVADWIFAPSPLVRRSLLEAGIPHDRILSSSYGWSPGRMTHAPRTRSANAPPVFLFVGAVCLRKGAHLLLDAWADAAVKGRLDLVGLLDPEIISLAGRHVERLDVRVPGFVRGIAAMYADADVFAFPTLEEGSALVIYEAMAHGLPILTSPMGAGDVVRDGVEGIVRDPYDRDAWVSELRRLAADAGLRMRLGAAARARAQEYTWDKVAARRRAQIVAALDARRAARPRTA